MLGVYYIRYQLPSDSNKQMLQQAKLLVARRDTLAVAFAFFSKNLERWQGCMNDILSVYVSGLSNWYTNRWLGLSNLNCKNQTFCSQRWWGGENNALAPSCPSHLVKLSLPNI